MNSVFSLDDSSEPFWPATTMNRSESEWALERFLQEVTVSSSSSAASESPAAAVSVAQLKPDDDVTEIKKPQILSPELRHQQSQHPLPHPRPLDHGNPSVAVDSDEYRALLKSKLDLACAAVAMARASSVKPEDIPTVAEDQGLHPVSGSQTLRAGPVVSMGQSKTNGASLDGPALPTTQSGSSREDSDDDELEGDTETNELGAPADAKRARRMQSNRESARRSRRRKQEQLSDLESQVGQLRDERTSLLTRFTDINQKCDEASVDNRILKADIETLRAKVKMAEEQVKRVTGLNPMILARSNIPCMGVQFFDGHMNSSINDIVPMQPNANQFFHSPIPGVANAAPHLQRLNNNFPNNSLVPLKTDTQIDNRTSNVGGMTPVQHPANGQSMGNTPAVHHVHKQIGTTVCPGGPLPASESGLPHTVANDNQKK